MVISFTEFKIGDLVIIKDELTPPTKWPLGRIIELHEGKDGLVRVAEIKTALSQYKRSIHRLIYLPVDEESAQLYHILVNPA